MNTPSRGSGVPPEVSTRNKILRHVPKRPSVDPTSHPSAPIKKRMGNYLPHWTRDSATYAVTFRLADSLPRATLESWLSERHRIIQTAEQVGRPLSKYEEKRLRELHSERVESYLDAGHGACWMRHPAIAQIVVDALKHFEGERYLLSAWCVMPNHVHVVLQVLAGHELSDILHSWKSFTAKAVNRALKRTGSFWQEEYYDHLVRDEDELNHAIRHVMENPEKAGLTNWPWLGRPARNSESNPPPA